MIRNLPKVRTCKICGKEFKPISSNNVYCSRPCAKEAKRRNVSEYSEKYYRKSAGVGMSYSVISSKDHKEHEKKMKQANKQLQASVKSAKDAGLSYGYYMAMKRMEEIKA